MAGNAIALATAASALFVFRLQDFSRGVLAVYFLSSSAVLIGKRTTVRWLLRRVRARGYNLKHMLVIGSGKLARRYVENVQADPTLGIHVEQCLAPAKGMLEQLESRLHDAGIDEVILALAPDELGVTVDVIQVCEKCGTKISVVPFYNDVIPTRPTIDMVGNLKLIQLRTTPLDEPANAFIKRAFDIVVSGLLLGPPESLVSYSGHCHPAFQPRTGAVPSGADRAKQKAVYHVQISQHACQRRAGHRVVISRGRPAYVAGKSVAKNQLGRTSPTL